MPRSGPLSSAFKTTCLKLKDFTHYRQIVAGLLHRLLFSDQEYLSGVYNKRECEASVPRIALLSMNFRSSHFVWRHLFS